MNRIISAILFTLLTFVYVFPKTAQAETKTTSYYNIDTQTTSVKGRSVTTVSVKGKGGFHCNTLYPWKLTLTPDPGITLKQTVLKKKDAAKFSEGIVEFEVKYTPKAGKAISGKLKFSVCNAKQCKMEVVSLKL